MWTEFLKLLGEITLVILAMTTIIIATGAILFLISPEDKYHGQKWRDK